MIRKYLEISRLFNMGLTGVAPMLGALAMWNQSPQALSLPYLLILFCIGCLAHVYGFVLNDIVDVHVDKLSKELIARPLVSGTISRKNAGVFAFACMILSFVLSLYYFNDILQYLPLLLTLVVAYVLATIYDIASKKYPGMDGFVAGAVFFLIVFGAWTVGTPTYLSIVVAFIGAIQVVFMNMINGAIKDIDHDEQGMAKTVAIRLGAKARAGMITLPLSFKTVGYGIEVVRSFLIFLPFVLGFLAYTWWQLVILILLTMLTFLLIYKLFSVKVFERNQIRKRIGLIVIFMYATTPVMLSSLNMYIALAAFIPPLWFFGSNLVLHRTVFEPKTM